MAKGYSSVFVNEVNSADSSKIGVRFGKVCIQQEVPVSDVSEYFKVTRMTVYSWFKGKTNVPEKYWDQMQKLITRLS